MHLVLAEISKEVPQMTSQVVKSCFNVPYIKRILVILFTATIENSFQFAFSRNFS